MERCLLHLCAPLSLPMALKHRLDRTDGAGRVVWDLVALFGSTEGEDFGVEVHALLTWGPST